MLRRGIKAAKLLPRIAPKLSQDLYRDGLPRLAGRKFMPGSDRRGFPSVLCPPGPNFPYKVDVPDFIPNEYGLGLDHMPQWIDAFKERMEGLVDVHGAVLLKGLPLDGAKDFGVFMRHLGYPLLEYVGGTGVREEVQKNVNTASREPPQFTIELHNEMADNIRVPKYVLFYCQTPASQGGETVIADVRQIYDSLDKTVIDKLVRLGVQYFRYMPCRNDKTRSRYVSWQEVFRSDCTEKVDAIIGSLGSEYQHEWHDNGAISVWFTLPAIRPHPITGEEVWLNGAYSCNASYLRNNPEYRDEFSYRPDSELFFHTFYGDGSVIEPEVLQHLRERSWNCAVGFKMNQGEVIVMDNIHVQHARMSFEGERKLLVSLVPFQ